MARKTAMGKEPGKVSIAIPKSEKDRLAGVARHLPGKPRPMDDKGNFTDKQSLDRVSPGVYRNSQGKLVGSKGQALPKSSPIQNALQGAAVMQENVQPAPRPNQRLPQQPMSPGFGPNATLADLQNLYPNEDMNSQVFGGPAMTTGFGPKPYPMQNQMYSFPQGMQRLDYQQKYPPGTPMPNLQQMQEMFQQQQQAAQQPQSVAGLLQRNR